VRQYGKRFYWVPEEYRNEFLEVALRTTGVRTDPSDAAAYYEVTFVAYINILPGRRGADGLSNPIITFRIDQPVPNDNGVMTAVVNGQECKFRLQKTDQDDFPGEDKDTLDDADADKAIARQKDRDAPGEIDKEDEDKEEQKDKDKHKYDLGTPTRTLKLKYVYNPGVAPGRVKGTDLWSVPFAPQDVVNSLTNHVVRIKLDSYQPTAKALDDTLGSIRTQTELLRLNQLQLLSK
jgi:hypothetical protein